MSSFVWVVHESRPDHAYRVPGRYLNHPDLSRGLHRVDDGLVEFDKTVVEVETFDGSAAAEPTTIPAVEANTEQE